MRAASYLDNALPPREMQLIQNQTARMSMVVSALLQIGVISHISVLHSSLILLQLIKLRFTT